MGVLPSGTPRAEWCSGSELRGLSPSTGRPRTRRPASLPGPTRFPSILLWRSVRFPRSSFGRRPHPIPRLYDTEKNVALLSYFVNESWNQNWCIDAMKKLIPFVTWRHANKEDLGLGSIHMHFQPIRPCVESHLIGAWHHHVFVNSIRTSERAPPKLRIIATRNWGLIRSYLTPLYFKKIWT